LPHHEAGGAAPEIPTFAEQGLPGYVMDALFAVIGPEGGHRTAVTPRPALPRLPGRAKTPPARVLAGGGALHIGYSQDWRPLRGDMLAAPDLRCRCRRRTPPMPTSSLGFTVTLARDLHTLRQACALRAVAYAHHLADRPEMASALAEPDATDLAPGTAVLVCRDKKSAQIVGTARIQRNHPQPLPIEDSVVLPEALAGRTRAEITRLAIRPGADALLRPMLVKACWLYAVAAQIQTLVIGARSAALVRIYKGLGFTDLRADAPGARQVPLAHAGGLAHHVLSFDVVSAERQWHATRHAWYAFMVQTWHPDLELITDPSPTLRDATAPRSRRGAATLRPAVAAGRRRAAPAPADRA